MVGEHNESLPAGVAGQIVLRGRLPHVLLHEYFHQPEATVEVFRHLWFHTGDGALQDDEGIFYFVDRVGGFIRVRGENISSFQIEDTINAHPGVVVSAAFPIKAAEGLEDDIVVYIVPAPGSRLSAEAREYGRTRKTATYEIKVTDGDGTLIAVCQALAYRKGTPLPFL